MPVNHLDDGTTMKLVIQGDLFLTVCPFTSGLSGDIYTAVLNDCCIFFSTITAILFCVNDNKKAPSKFRLFSTLASGQVCDRNALKSIMKKKDGRQGSSSTKKNLQFVGANGG